MLIHLTELLPWPLKWNNISLSQKTVVGLKCYNAHKAPGRGTGLSVNIHPFSARLTQQPSSLAAVWRNVYYKKKYDLKQAFLTTGWAECANTLSSYLWGTVGLKETRNRKHIWWTDGRLLTIASAGQALKHCDELCTVPDLHLETISTPHARSPLGAYCLVGGGPQFLWESSFCPGFRTP